MTDGRVRRVLYTSGIWVYGDTGGRVVDEQAPLTGPLPLVAWRVAHEEAALAFAPRGADVTVFQPGIVYGGTRGILGEWFARGHRGEPVTWPGDGDAALEPGARRGRGRGVPHRRRAAGSGAGADARRALPAARRRRADGARRRRGGGAGDRRAGAREWPREEVLEQLGAYGEALLASQRVSAAKARRELGWAPRHDSFVAHAEELYREWLAGVEPAAPSGGRAPPGGPARRERVDSRAPCVRAPGSPPPPCSAASSSPPGWPRPPCVSSRLRRAPAARGLVLRWERLRVRPPLRAELRGVTLSTPGARRHPARGRLDRRRRGPLVARPAAPAPDRGRGRPRPRRRSCAAARRPARHARARRTRSAGARRPGPARREAAPRGRVAGAAAAGAGAAGAAPRGPRPRRCAPRRTGRRRAAGASPGSRSTTRRPGMHLRAGGTLALGDRRPLRLELTYGHDDRLVGGAALRLDRPGRRHDGDAAADRGRAAHAGPARRRAAPRRFDAAGGRPHPARAWAARSTGTDRA